MQRCLAVTTCLIPLALGCSDAGSESDSTATNSNALSSVVMKATDSEAEAEDSDSRFVSREALPEHWLPPIQNDDQFFTPPAPTSTPVAPTEAKVADARVRLLGFATVGSGEETTKKAILKIGDKLVYMLVGDTHAGVELISIEDQSVSLQQGRERWTLALMSQPLTNAPVPYPTASRRSTRPGGGARNSGYADPSSEPSPFPQDDFGPGASGGFPAQLPQGLPEGAMPEIPEIDLPDLDIPGFEMPEIPGF